MNIPETKIKFLFKRVQYQEVEISQSEEHGSINTAEKLVSMVDKVKADPYFYLFSDNWCENPDQGMTLSRVSYEEDDS